MATESRQMQSMQPLHEIPGPSQSAVPPSMIYIPTESQKRRIQKYQLGNHLAELRNDIEASTCSTPFVTDDPNRTISSDRLVNYVDYKKEQYGININLQQFMDDLDIKTFTRLPPISQGSRLGTASTDDSAYFTARQRYSYTRIDRLDNPRLPGVHRPTIAHNEYFYSDLHVRPVPRPATSHYHSPEVLHLRDLEISHFDPRQLDYHQTIVQNGIDGRLYGQFDSLLPQLRRNECKYTNMHDKLDKITMQVEQEGVYHALTRGMIPENADIKGIMEHRLHLQSLGSSFMLENKTLLLNPHPFKHVRPLDRLEETSFSSQLRLQKGRKLSKYSFSSHTNSAKNTVAYPILVHTHPHLRKPLAPQHTEATSREASDQALIQENILEKDERFIWANYGHIHTENPAYKIFIEKNQDRLSPLNSLIARVRRLLIDFNVEYAELNCTKLEQFAAALETQHLGVIPIADCITNPEAKRNLSDNKRKYQGAHKRQLAAITIQCKYRQYKQSGSYKNHVRLTNAANVLRRAWIYKMCRRKLFEVTRIRHDNVNALYHLRRNQMVETIKKTQSVKRVIIQFGYQPEANKDMIPDLNVGRQVASRKLMCRFSCLRDENVELVIVLPYMSEEVNRYYKDIIANGLPDKNPIWVGRLHFIVPETAKFYKHPIDPNAENSANLTSMLLTSEKALKLLELICEKKPAYMLRLKVPIFGPTVEAYIHHSLKSNVQQFFVDAGLAALSGLKCDPDITEHDFAKALFGLVRSSKGANRLVIHNDQKRLSDASLFSTQKEIGVVDSRQAADFVKTATDFESVPARKQIMKLRKTLLDKLSPSLLLKSIANKTLVESIYVEALPHYRANPRMRCVEFGMMVNPDGSFELLGSSEQICSSDYNLIGRVVPQQIWEHDDLLACAEKIAQFCPTRGIIGPVTVEVLVYKTFDDQIEYCLRDMSLRLTATMLRALSILSITGCTFNPKCGQMVFFKEAIPFKMRYLKGVAFGNMHAARNNFIKHMLGDLGDSESRVAFYCEQAFNSQLECIPRDSIFKMTTHGLHYDLWKKRGTFVPIRDQITRSSIPLVCIEDTWNDAVESYLKMLVLIDRHFYIPGTRGRNIIQTNFKVLARDLMEYLLAELENVDKTLPPLDSTDLEGIVEKLINIPRSRPPSGDRKEDSQQVTKRVIEHHISNESALIIRAEIMSKIFSEEDPTFANPVIDPPYVAPPRPRLHAISEKTVSKRTLTLMDEIEAVMNLADEQAKTKEAESGKLKAKKAALDELAEISYEERLARRYKFHEQIERMRVIGSRVDNIEKRKVKLIDGMDGIMQMTLAILEKQGGGKKEAALAALEKIEKKREKEAQNKQAETVANQAVAALKSATPEKKQALQVFNFLSDDA